MTSPPPPHASSTGAPGETPTPDLRQAAGQFLRLLRLVRPYWGPLMRGILFALLLGLVGMVSPLLTKLLIDEVYPTGNVSLMYVLVGGILTLSLAASFLGTVRGYFSLYLNTHLGSATRLMFFNHLQHLEVGFFDRHQVGEINSRFQDVGRALDSINRVFQTVFVQGVYLLLVPPVLFFLEWRLALVAIISLPLTFSVTVLSGPVLRRSWKRSSEAYADLNAFQIETLSHIRTFKTMGLEHHVFSRARNLFENAMDQQLRAGGLAQGFGLVNGVLRALNTAIFTGFGWYLILQGRMTLGDFLAFTAYTAYLYNPVTQLIQLFSEFQQSAVHLGRMFEYLDAPAEQDPSVAYEAPGPIEHPLRGDYRLRSVDFGYHEGQRVLEGVDLSFPAGTVTALVGPSGSGKTSLMRLLAGLERPVSGELTVDGLGLRDGTSRGSDLSLPDLSLTDLRRQIAVVWQEVSLIKGSLWENLTLGDVEPSLEEVDEAVRRCRLDDVLAELPEGYETAVSEWGATLSAGQRQRVALARALLRRAPILLLDEATANIDVETEMEVLRGLFAGRGETTVIFVTHRLASATLADRICVLEAGRIAGVGTHEELIRSCGVYQRLAGAAGVGRLSPGATSLAGSLPDSKGPSNPASPRLPSAGGGGS